MIKEQFFPTTIYGHDTQLDNNFLANEIVAWSKQNKGVQKTNVNGWHSETNMHELPQFKPLVDELFKMVSEVFNEEWVDRQPRLGNMWANINYQGGYNKPHIHPNSLFSGVHYIKAPENSGDLICNEPRAGAQLNMPTRKKGRPPKELWREVHLKPVEGRICLLYTSPSPRDRQKYRMPSSA